jgi:hypothetical protein
MGEELSELLLIALLREYGRRSVTDGALGPERQRTSAAVARDYVFRSASRLATMCANGTPNLNVTTVGDRDCKSAAKTGVRRAATSREARRPG